MKSTRLDPWSRADRFLPKRSCNSGRPQTWLYNSTNPFSSPMELCFLLSQQHTVSDLIFRDWPSYTTVSVCLPPGN